MGPILETLHVLKLNIFVVLFQHRMLASNVLGISTSGHLRNPGNPNSVIGVLRSLPTELEYSRNSDDARIHTV